MKNGYINVATIVPYVSIANPLKNIEDIIIKVKKQIREMNIDIVLTPELSVTGYTCGDLFTTRQLYIDIEKAIDKFLKESNNYFTTLFVLGVPIQYKNKLFNCAMYIQHGKILALVPKTYLANYNEFYEKRWFSSGSEIKNVVIPYCDQEVNFGTDILLQNNDLVIGTDICEDLWCPIPPSTISAINGANLILNLSASNNTATKAEYRRDLVRMQSAKCYCGYVYASAGPSESSSDVVYSGHCIIAENGKILTESQYEEKTNIATIDIEKLNHDRMKFNSFSYDAYHFDKEYKMIPFLIRSMNRKKEVNPYPFVPKDDKKRQKRCNEILDIQAHALATRLRKCNFSKTIIGISGGLDSTLALLATTKAFDLLDLPYQNIIGITMPGFGTSNKTLTNSLDLMNELGITIKNIPIKEACMVHFKDIGQEEDNYDVTYENAQARERTQILFDIANKENAIVIGTGDLSELVLGWCTYNADHMSNYGINVGVPKTLVKFLIETIAIQYKKEKKTKLNEILMNIIDTPISPELLPLDKEGNIQQETQNTIGKYDLHDFFLYHFLRNGFTNEKIKELAICAFKNVSEEEITKTLEIFTNRFKTQQFKRNSLPDGPKVGSVSVSPRGDLRMPSDL